MEYTNRQYWNDIINRSLCKFFILRILYTQSSYGYEIIRNVAELTGNFCVPTEGAVYPVLRQFERDGCVTSEKRVVSGRERKVYTLTPLGREAFEVGAQVWEGAIPHIERASSAAVRDDTG
ncbi:MAG: PadR family transcriptional regulator [Actinomycetota bacterium]|nr:PadR family transcriptional regulator [Actinomycetota bacterium]